MEVVVLYRQMRIANINAYQSLNGLKNDFKSADAYILEVDPF